MDDPEEVELSVKTIVSPSHFVADGVNFAIGLAVITTGFVIVLSQPSVLTTTKVTLYEPAVENKCDGFCCMEVLLAPDFESPKFQLQLCIFPAPLGEVRSVKITGWFAQRVVETLKFGIGDGIRVTGFSINPLHPVVVVTVSFTLKEVAVPEKICETFGEPGKFTVTIGVESPKSQTQDLIDPVNPVGT